MNALPPLALYVHMPWCVRKCPYCDFNSHVAPETIPQQQYVDALIEDLAIDAGAAQGRALVSIFFGGGTPSLFAPDQVGRFLEAARSLVTFAPDIEVTLEANPGTVEHGRFSGYRDAGINRVSLGAQTFDPDQLRLLGRIHGSGDIARAVDEVRSAGLENFNLDLMYGLPAQTLQQALADLDAALAFEPAHISHYQLTLEPNTLFAAKPPAGIPDDDASWDIQEHCQGMLAEAGFAQYEVSAYARPDRQCAHNLNYWHFGDYLGIGAGAHSKLSFADRIVRQVRYKQPKQYLDEIAKGAPLMEDGVVKREDIGFEFMLNALRLTEGVPAALFAERTGYPLSLVQRGLEEAEARGLIERDPSVLRPTPLGQRFLNDLQQLFLAD